MTLQALISEVEKLPRDEQAELLSELIRMVRPTDDDVALTPRQREDLKLRIAEYRSGKAELIDGPEAMAKLRSRT